MTEHLHADDVPLSLSVLRALVGLTESNSATGPRNGEPTSTGTSWPAGSCPPPRKPPVHIARGCAIIGRHGGGLPNSVSGPIRAAIDGLTDSGRPH
jgi:hypothetical protein